MFASFAAHSLARPPCAAAHVVDFNCLHQPFFACDCNAAGVSAFCNVFSGQPQQSENWMKLRISSAAEPDNCSVLNDGAVGKVNVDKLTLGFCQRFCSLPNQTLSARSTPCCVSAAVSILVKVVGQVLGRADHVVKERVDASCHSTALAEH